MAPWWAKIIAKLVLARLPVDYRTWADRFGVFRHGAMDRADYALQVFRRHHEAAGSPTGFACLELGPGDALSSAVLARAFGAREIVLVDVGRYASADVSLYREIAAFAARAGLPAPDLDGCTTLEQVLAACNARYLTDGLASLRALPSGSIDLLFSQSCLEHVRKHELAATLAETRRVLADGGVASHRVDLMDHLGDSLNNLRFPEPLWESEAMADSGFYTNRVRYRAMLELLHAAGFGTTVTKLHPFEGPRTPRGALHPDFHGLDEADLDVAAFDVVCRPLRAAVQA